jgi:hypothetical protein
MTIPTGAVSISNIVSEFGGSAPHSLSEYYSGGALVYTGAVGYPNGTATTIPTSGVITLANFRGASRKISLTISSNQTNLNLRTWALANGWSDTNTFLEITIGSGVYLLSNSTSTPALTINGSFPIGLRLINNGYVIGYGGAGGAGGSGLPQAGFAGSAGGTGISIASPLFIVNNNTIAGGGGGGGGGGGSNFQDFYGGGGGGGGVPYAVGGQPGLGTGPGTGRAGAGGTATLSTAGSGGGSQYAAGAAGGGWGTAGGTGASSSQRAGGAGGAAGNYVSGNSYVTWEANGTRLGNVS